MLEIPSPVKNKKKCLVHPSNKYKIYWDLFIVALLTIVCVIIPYRVAFVGKETNVWKNAYIVFDCFFFIDIIVTFFTIYEDKALLVDVTDRRQIALKYLQTWFFIDLLSIIPLDEVIK